MTAPWRQTFSTTEPLAKAVRAAIPVIQTERLTLRAPTIADWAVLEPIWTTQRAKHIGGPFTEEDAYLDFAQLAAGWVLRGFGALVIEDRTTQAVLGIVGLFVEYGDPEPGPEAGWLLTEPAEGRGIAEEAAKAILAFGHDTLGFDEIVSYVALGNVRSIALAERLGSVADAKPFVDHDGDRTLIFRHVEIRPDNSPTQSRQKSDTKNGVQND